MKKEVLEDNFGNLVEIEDEDIKFEREHVYEDEQGNPTNKVTKNITENSEYKFSIYNFQNGIWQPGINKEKLYPYRLPELLKAVEENRTIFIVSSEKDADTIMDLSDEFTATTAITSSKWKFKYEYNKYLGKVPVIIFKDDTEYGQDFTEITKRNIKYGRQVGICPILKVKQFLDIKDSKVTDITEVREMLQDDEKLIQLLKRIQKGRNK